ncbi:uncharacterized protein LOC134332943 [Trichomycterus rosablanca]|uniref:uncharacterized protein LOC134332943 n=1 Tax=Trichomycterus rosablanca TaxID=2290929 RepID=UPI002F35EBD3
MRAYFRKDISRGVSLRRVIGVLHGRVELQDGSAHSEDVLNVDWVKQQNSNSSVLLSPPLASRIDVSCYNDTLTLRCEVIGDFVSLQWMQNGLPLPADQRFIFTEMNTTMQVSNLTSIICSTYTCSVSNEAGFKETHVNITGNITEVCLNRASNHPYLKFILLSTGITGFLALLIILICIYKCYGCIKSDPPDRRTRDHREQNIQMQEPVYDEPLQEGAATPKVEPLPYVYSDFIKPKASHQATADQAEDFGYSTIPEILNTQSSQNLHSLKAD